MFFDHKAKKWLDTAHIITDLHYAQETSAEGQNSSAFFPICTHCPFKMQF